MGVISIYRAVGVDEYYSIIDTGQFSCHPRMADVKYFALDFAETLEYASKSYNQDVVAIFEVVLRDEDLKILGDFTFVDPSIFKSGTVVIHAEDLDMFNNSAISVSLKV